MMDVRYLHTVNVALLSQFFLISHRCKDVVGVWRCFMYNAGVVGCLAVFHVYSGGGWAVFVDCCPSVDPQLTCISISHMLLEVRGRRVERTSIN